MQIKLIRSLFVLALGRKSWLTKKFLKIKNRLMQSQKDGKVNPMYSKTICEKNNRGLHQTKKLEK